MSVRAASSPWWGGKIFPIFALGVVLANALLVARYPALGAGPAPEWPVMIDLLVFLPLACLTVYWRRGREAVVKALICLGAGALAGSWILPAESKVAWLLVEDLRLAAIVLLVLFQAGVMAALVLKARREWHHENPEIALERAIGERFGNGVFARLLQLESRVWLYALARRPVRHEFPGLRHFPVGRQGMNASNQLGFLIIVGAEIPLAHLLIHLFSPTAAVVITGLSVYGFLFLLAEYRAALYRPLSITVQGLRIRYGVLQDFLIEWSAIATVAPARGSVRRRKERLRLIGMGEANLRIELVPGARVAGILGSPQKHEIFLGVDDPHGLIAEIRARCPQA